jgi:hypothetical protein
MKKINEIDRKFRVARYWSNNELRQFAQLFTGDICNVSGWRDSDKEGGVYSDYFTKKSTYTVTNFHDTKARGYQGDIKNEVVLDLTKNIECGLEEKFDVVFNHTTLEHVFDVRKAFTNLCKLSKDVVIIVVPFIQETHGDYGDFWRFTPQSIFKMFEENGFSLVYINSNDSNKDSIYIFAIGSKSDNWLQLKLHPDNKIGGVFSKQVGTRLIKNSNYDNFINLLIRTKNKILDLF